MKFWYVINRITRVVERIKAQLYNIKPNIKIDKGNIFEPRIAAHSVIVPSNYIYTDPDKFIYN